MLAACSTATVSRVINTPDTVRADLRERVQKAIAVLDYTPNSAARSLRSRRTRLIAAVVPTLDHAIFIHVLRGLEAEMKGSGYSLIVSTSEFDLVREFEQAQLLLERGAEALVLVGQLHHHRLLSLIERKRIMAITTYSYPSATPPVLSTVGFDNAKAARLAAEHLLRLGHRSVGIISGMRRDNDRVQLRIAGFCDAMANAGHPVRPDQIMESAYSINDGQASIERLLAHPKPPTAVFCVSDILAFGVLSGCVKRGIKVPEQLSVVGFDNLDFTAHLQPPLTTVEVPGEEMGRYAARFLLSRLNGQPELSEVFEMPTRLVKRCSTKPVASDALNHV